MVKTLIIKGVIAFAVSKTLDRNQASESFVVSPHYVDLLTIAHL